MREGTRRGARTPLVATFASMLASLIGVGVVAGVLEVVGREARYGLGAFVLVFAFVLGRVARSVGQRHGEDGVGRHILRGLTAGLVGSLAVLVSDRESMPKVAFVTVLATCCGTVLFAEKPGRESLASRADSERETSGFLE